MKLPGALERDIAFKAIWFAVIAALFATVLGFAIVQTVRLEGLKVWPIELEGWKPRAERLQRELDAVPVAQIQARAKAEAAKSAAETTYRTIAQEADDDAQTEERRELAAADRYIAGHRVRAQGPADRGSGAGAPAGDRSSSDGEEAGGAAELDDPGTARDFAAGGDLVAITAEDLKICTVNTVQAEVARRWAIELEAASAAPDAPD